MPELETIPEVEPTGGAPEAIEPAISAMAASFYGEDEPASAPAEAVAAPAAPENAPAPEALPPAPAKHRISAMDIELDPAAPDYGERVVKVDAKLKEYQSKADRAHYLEQRVKELETARAEAPAARREEPAAPVDPWAAYPPEVKATMHEAYSDAYAEAIAEAQEKGYEPGDEDAVAFATKAAQSAYKTQWRAYQAARATFEPVIQAQEAEIAPLRQMRQEQEIDAAWMQEGRRLALMVPGSKVEDMARAARAAAPVMTEMYGPGWVNSPDHRFNFLAVLAENENAARAGASAKAGGPAAPSAPPPAPRIPVGRIAPAPGRQTVAPGGERAFTSLSPVQAMAANWA